jgi:hypothetical protein
VLLLAYVGTVLLAALVGIVRHLEFLLTRKLDAMVT